MISRSLNGLLYVFSSQRTPEYTRGGLSWITRSPRHYIARVEAGVAPYSNVYHQKLTVAVVGNQVSPATFWHGRHHRWDSSIDTRILADRRCEGVYIMSSRSLKAGPWSRRPPPAMSFLLLDERTTQEDVRGSGGDLPWAQGVFLIGVFLGILYVWWSSSRWYARRC